MIATLLGAAGAMAAAAAVSTDPSVGTITIAPGVVMPLINNGAITNGSWFPNNTLETPGIEAWLGVGGRGVDTAWCYDNQPQVGAAVHNTSVPRGDIFLTSKASTASRLPPAAAAAGTAHFPLTGHR
jgi:diketogulonate reductase-like aldo/keto reductase